MKPRARSADRATGALFDAPEPAERRLAGPAIVAGIDEAGLGPLLGPLTLGVCALRVPEHALDPWTELAHVASASIDDDAAKFVVADSKVVFTRNPRGARRLERTVLGFLAARQRFPALAQDARAFLRAIERMERSALEDEFFADELDARLPRHAEPGALLLDATALADGLRSRAIELVELRTTALTPRALNASFAETDNKSRTHWLATRALLHDLWTRFAADPALPLDVVVDRQGGRMHYAAALEEAFPRARVVLVSETAPLSAYRVEEPATGRSSARSMHIAFREKAEHASFAVALASCAAKFSRELSMDAFNAWFSKRDPKLLPTAGYVEDGRRWLADAAAVVERERIPAEHLVRNR